MRTYFFNTAKKALTYIKKFNKLGKTEVVLNDDLNFGVNGTYAWSETIIDCEEHYKEHLEGIRQCTPNFLFSYIENENSLLKFIEYMLLRDGCLFVERF